jgi:hypothetical protein
MHNFDAHPLIDEGDERNRVAMSARAPKQPFTWSVMTFLRIVIPLYLFVRA